MEKNAGRGRSEQKPDHSQLRIRRPLRDHGLGWKTRGEWKRRNRKRPYDAADRGERHGAKEAAELGALAPAGHKQHRARRHEQQRLVDDVHECVGRRPVERHLTANADAGNHEPDLIDDAVGQDAPHVVFEDRIDDTIEHHIKADINQELCAGKASQQNIDRGLGGKRREKDRAAPGSFGIGVGEPGGKGRRAGIDEKACENEIAGPAVRRHGLEREITGARYLTGYPRHQQGAPQQVNGRVSKPRTGSAPPTGPNDKCRADGHQLPEDKERYEVAGKHRADCAARINEGRSELQRPPLIERKEGAGKRHPCKDRCEKACQSIGLEWDEAIAEVVEGNGRPVRHLPHECQSNERCHKQQRRAPEPRPGQGRQQEPRRNEHQARRHERADCPKISRHNSFPAFSKSHQGPLRRQ